ncbi:MAG: hypothetical protein HOC23_01625 [Halieaceae bacterium]|nr:hypothetical protein [Halieaceae bacterium]
MHELRRRACLNDLGIASYVSRSQLPGAAITRRLALVTRTQEQSVDFAFPERSASALQQSGILSENTLSGAGAPAEGVEPGPGVDQGKASQQAVQIQPFSIGAILAGGWLWLEELVSPPLSQSQVRLVQAMALALGWGREAAESGQFDWPIHTNAQLDLGEDAVRASLGAFIGRRLERGQCKGIVLLGDDCVARLNPAQFHGVPCVTTVGTAQMLEDSRLKSRAWRDLLPYAQRA